MADNSGATKFMVGLVSGVLLAIVLAIGFFVLAIVLAMRGAGQPAIADGSVLTLELRGGVPEHLATDFSFDWIESGPPPTVKGLRDALRRAAEDDRIAALAIECAGLGVGWAKAEEIRDAIVEFKESEKPVIAYMQVAGMLDYYVATAADEVYLFPEGVLDVKGLRAEVGFYKDMFEKIGVQVEMERVGRYKNAVEPYSRSSMSDDFREVLNAMLDGILALFLQATSESRGMTAEAMRAALDEGPFLPDRAVELGLVDGVKYPDEVGDRLEELLDVEEHEETPLGRYAASAGGGLQLPGGDQIAIVYGVGTIMRGESQNDPFFGSVVMGSETIASTLKKLRDDETVKAVVLRIDSPGGDAIASDEMWRALKLLREEKPVVVSMSDVAASGGYYMAMGEDVPVVAYPGTITGSIGVYFGKINLGKLYEKIGLNTEILTRGKFAAIETETRGLTEEERTKLRESIEEVYRTFVQKVADARGASWEEIHEVAQGRVWMGGEALDRGLVDELGGLDRALEMAKLEAGLEADEEIRVTTHPAPKSFLQTLLQQNRMIFAPKLPVEIKLPRGFPALAEGGLLALWDYAVEIR